MEKEHLPVYEFDGFRLDSNRKCLWFADEIVSLTPKSLDTLIVLVRNRAEVVAKELLLDEVWADTFVEETTLAQNIHTIRKTLAKFHGEKEFVMTIPRRGYRFVADVQEIFGDEDVFVVEKHTRTHIVADQKRIHDSADSAVSESALVKARPTLFRRFGSPWLAVVIALSVSVSVFLGVRSFVSKQNLAASAFQKFRVDELVAGEGIRHAAISPNGKYVVVTEQAGAERSLVLYQIENGNPLKLVDKFSGIFIGAAFSPDNERIFYAVYEKSAPDQPNLGALYEIPLLGGAPRQILRDIDSAAAISPDKTQVAFIRRDIQTRETALVLAGLDGTSEKKLAVRPVESGFTTTGVAWAPDGRTISSTVIDRTETGRNFAINTVDTLTGEQKTLGNAAWAWAGQTFWLQDGSGIGVVAYGAKSPNNNDEIWLVSYPRGDSRVLSNGINGIYGVSASADSKTIVAVKSNKITNFLVGSVESPEKSHRIITKMGDDSLLPLGADWTNDGQIVFSATQNGNADLWKIDAGTGIQKQLTADLSREILPRVSADGRLMIFLSNRSGKMNVWRTNADGTAPTQITFHDDVSDAVLAPDASTVYYIAPAPAGSLPVLWTASINGENSRQLTDRQTYAPRVSPDGRAIAAFYPNPSVKRMMPVLLSPADGSVIRFLDSPRTDSIPLIEWNADGSGLYLILEQNDKFSLWKQPTGEGDAIRLSEWEHDSIFRLAVSKDGTRVFYEKGIETNGVVLLRNLE